MKKMVQVTEVENEGFMSLMGQEVLLFCMSYIYAGVLTGVNDDCVLLEQAKIVYDTGAFTAKGYTDAQDLPGKKIYIMKKNVEAFGVGK